MAPDRAGVTFERLLRVLASAGGAVLLALMAMTVFDVVGRSALGLPFLGAYEVTELAMVLIVALGLPYCAVTGGHVAVDVFSPVLDRPRLAWVSVLVHLAGAVLLGVVAWQTAVYAMGSRAWGDATNMMAIPKFPFQLVTAAGAALFALVLLRNAWMAARPAHGAPTE